MALVVSSCASAPPLTDGERSAGELARIAFGSCAHQDYPQPIWDAVIAAEPDLFIFLGDNVYADTTDMAEMRAIYERQGGTAEWQRLRRATQILATWDDHDYGENDGGARYPAKEGSKTEFMRFFEVPEDAPMRTRPGIYSARVFGPPGRRVQVILLDTRTFRGPLVRRPEAEVDSIRGRYLPQTDTSVPMLGAAQWDWLDEQLRMPAELRLLVSSVQFVPEEHGWEKWGNLDHERSRLLELLAMTEAEGVILLSGDRHMAEISRLPAEEGPGYPLHEVTASGLNRSGGGRDDEPNRYRLGQNYRGDNFGLLTVDWLADAPSVLLEIRGVDGRVELAHTLHLEDLEIP